MKMIRAYLRASAQDQDANRAKEQIGLIASVVQKEVKAEPNEEVH